MNPERDTARIVRSWLENGVTDLPDRVLDPVLDQLPSTPQRRHRWQARRSTRMNATLKIVTAAAAVVVVGVIGLNLLPGSTQQGVGAAPMPAPTATTAPTAAPSASPIPYLPTSGVIEPGRYRIPETQHQAASLTIEVPAGWTSLGNDMLTKDYEQGTVFGPLLAAWPISGTFVDPCTDHTLVQPDPGPGIDTLADALANQPGTEAGPPTAVLVDGYRAKLVASTVTADIEPCGPDGFWLWASPDGDRRYVQGTNEVNRMYIVDVDGERLTFNGRYPAATTAADRAELDAIIASIDIQP